MNIEQLKRQHQDINQKLIGLESFLGPDVAAKAFDISLKIGLLSGILTVHLKSEDTFLYPSLMASEQEGLKKTANRFVQEMGHLAQIFSVYKNKYMSANNIKKESQNFIIDTQAIISALRTRLNNEDKELYPLLDRGKLTGV